MVRKRNTRGWSVMKSKCASCPFGANGDPELAANVLNRTLFQSSQICHHPRLHGKRETHLCRGQRDEQLVLLQRMGLIEDATDAAFEKRSRELGVIE
jgi:hypothetical protein